MQNSAPNTTNNQPAEDLTGKKIEFNTSTSTSKSTRKNRIQQGQTTNPSGRVSQADQQSDLQKPIPMSHS